MRPGGSRYQHPQQHQHHCRVCELCCAHGKMMRGKARTKRSSNNAPKASRQRNLLCTPGAALSDVSIKFSLREVLVAIRTRHLDELLLLYACLVMCAAEQSHCDKVVVIRACNCTNLAMELHGSREVLACHGLRVNTSAHTPHPSQANKPYLHTGCISTPCDACQRTVNAIQRPTIV